MRTPFIYGQYPLPCALAGDVGKTLILTEEQVPDGDPKKCEEFFVRNYAINFGLDAGGSGPVLKKICIGAAFDKRYNYSHI